MAVLKRYIFTEDLKEGDKLPPERELADNFAVSHRVIREALSILAGKGIISKQHGRWAFVESFDRNLLQDGELTPPFDSKVDVYTTRCALEIGAACVASRYATEDDIEGLENIVREMEEDVEKGRGIAATEMRFHRALYRATHNEILGQLEELVM